MPYNKEVYEIVQKKLEILRIKEGEEAEKRRQTFYIRVPRAKEIEFLLSKTAIFAAKAIFSGSNVKEQLSELKEHNLALQKELESLIRQANLPTNHLQIQHQCHKCEDTGYRDGKMCSCMQRMLRQEAYDRLNKLSPISLCSFSTFYLEYYPEPIRKRMENIFNYCKNYAKEFKKTSPSLLLQGATGLGKTHLSLAIAKEAINKGYGVIYGSAPNIVSKLERERFSSAKYLNEAESESHFINCDLLILDDLGTEFSSTFTGAAVYNVVNSRIMLRKPTIINTNLSIKELEKSYTERLVSRIIGNHIRIEFLGSDIRQQKRKQEDQQIKTKFN